MTLNMKHILAIIVSALLGATALAVEKTKKNRGETKHFLGETKYGYSAPI